MVRGAGIPVGVVGFWRECARRLAGLVVAAASVCCVAASSAAAVGVINTIRVDHFPVGVSSDGNHVWVTDGNEFGIVTEIEASTGTVANSGIRVGRTPEGVSSDGTHVWVANHWDETVSEIEASTGRVVRTIHVGSDPEGVSSDGTHVWVANGGEGTITEIAASSGEVVRTIHVAIYPEGVSSDGTHVWVANGGEEPNEGTISEIEASTGSVLRTIYVGIGSEPTNVSSDGTHVWVTNGRAGTVSEIEASTGSVIRTIYPGLHPGSRPYGVSSDGIHVWVTDISEATLSEIEASTGTVVHRIGIGGSFYSPGFPLAVSSDGTRVWVTNGQESTVSEILPNADECAGSSGTVTLSPGLTGTAAVQTLKIKGTLTGCISRESFTGASYTAIVKTAGAVSCSVLTGAGEPATGAAKFNWTPKAKPSTGTLSLRLAETPGVALSGEVANGPYAPLSLSGMVSETFTGGATCGVPVGTKPAKAVKKGTFKGSAVAF
jgi:YVTN family beta-propeller protein